MRYYQILRKRRLDLNLSVQDVSIQTHLSPEYIRAIEDNNLDVFSDDFSYVRYFVHAYCDAIGVNWDAISGEVDATIMASSLAHQQALAAAQQKMAANVSSKSRKSGKRKKKKKSPALSRSAGKVSRLLNWNKKQDRLSATLILIAAGALIFLMILNAVVDTLSQRNADAAREAKAAELKEKELETQRLADQLASQKNDGDKTTQTTGELNIEASSDTNTFIVNNAVSADKPVILKLHMQEPGKVSIDLNGNNLTETEVSGDFTYDLNAPSACTVTLKVENFHDGDTLTLNDQAVSVSAKDLSDGQGTITLELKGIQDSSSQTNTTVNTEDLNANDAAAGLDFQTPQSEQSEEATDEQSIYAGEDFVNDESYGYEYYE